MTRFPEVVRRRFHLLFNCFLMGLLGSSQRCKILMHRHLGTTPAQREALELLTSGHTNTTVDKNTGGARLGGHAPFHSPACPASRRPSAGRSSPSRSAPGAWRRRRAAPGHDPTSAQWDGRAGGRAGGRGKKQQQAARLKMAQFPTWREEEGRKQCASVNHFLPSTLPVDSSCERSQVRREWDIEPHPVCHTAAERGGGGGEGRLRLERSHALRCHIFFLFVSHKARLRR